MDSILTAEELKKTYYNKDAFAIKQALQIINILKNVLKDGYFGIYFEDETIFTNTLQILKNKGYYCYQEDYRNTIFTSICVEPNVSTATQIVKATLKLEL